MRQRSELHAYQVRASTVIYEQTDVQHVMPMGSGKTATGLTAIRDLIDDGHIRAALVIAPKRVSQLVWPAEPREWEHLQDIKVRYVGGSASERLKKLWEPGADVYVVGRDNIKWLVAELMKAAPDHPLFDLLIVDELSSFKNPRSKRLKDLMKIRKLFKSVHGLTGTPRPNGYEDQFGPMKLLTNAKMWGRSFDEWQQMRFMPIDYNGYKWTIRPEWLGRTRTDINKHSLTISPDEMVKLPEIVPVFHWVDLPPAAQRQYKEMERQLVTQIKESGRSIAAVSAGVATGKLAQIVQGFLYGEGGNKDVEHIHTAKTDMLVELTEDLDVPCAIIYDLVEDLRILQDLWPDLPYFGNGTTDKQAERYEHDWNLMQLPRLAAHPASMGHGLNLQRGGNQLFWYGMTWSAELYDQTVKRFNRQGSTERLFNHHILARNTIDEAKYDRVVQKMSSQQAFVDYIRRV